MSRPKNGKTVQERKDELEKYNQSRFEHALAIHKEIVKDSLAKKTLKKP